MNKISESMRPSWIRYERPAIRQAPTRDGAAVQLQWGRKQILARACVTRGACDAMLSCPNAPKAPPSWDNMARGGGETCPILCDVTARPPMRSGPKADLLGECGFDFTHIFTNPDFAVRSRPVDTAPAGNGTGDWNADQDTGSVVYLDNTAGRERSVTV